MRALVLIALFVFVPDLARACAVCGFGEDESRVAYIGTTVFLSFLPLVLIGGTVFYYWRHHQRTQVGLAARQREITRIHEEDRARTRPIA